MKITFWSLFGTSHGSKEQDLYHALQMLQFESIVIFRFYNNFLNQLNQQTVFVRKLNFLKRGFLLLPLSSILNI